MQTLFEAITAFDTKALQELIELKLDLNQPCKDELHPLDVAMESILGYKAKINPNAIATAKLLIQAGAKVDRVLPHQRNWLHRIAMQPMPTHFFLFLNDEAEINKQKQQAKLEKPLQQQLLCQLAEVFIDAQLTFDAHDEFGETPLLQALRSNNQPLALLLIRAGAAINITDTRSSSPLHIACDRAMREVVQVLLEKGADINAIDAQAMKPFDNLKIPNPDDAISDANQTLDIAYHLLAHGAIAKPEQLFRWLKAAFHFKHEPLLNYLWQQQVATLIQDDGLTALHFADTPDLVAELMQHNAAQHINAVYKPSGDTPVLYCTRTLFFNNSQKPDECIALVKAFQAYNADLMVNNKQQETLLHQAIHFHIRLIQFLLEQGVPVNAQNYQGQTILHLAAKLGQLDLLEVLIRISNNQLLDNQGYTALEYLRAGNMPIEREAAQAYINRLSAITSTLLSVYPSNQLPKNAMALLRIAVSANSFSLVEALFQRGLKQCFNEMQERGDILNEIIRLNHVDMLQWFIARGLPINQPHIDGNTLLQQAVIRLKPKLISLLLQQGANVNILDKQDANLLQLFAQHFLKSYHTFESAEAWFNEVKASYKQLIANEALDLNQQDYQGKTVLDSFIDQYHHADISRVFIHHLLERGANLSAHQAKVLISLAASQQDWELIEYLLQTCKVVKSNYLSFIALLAIEQGYHLIFDTLLANGFAINERLPATDTQSALYPLEYVFYRAQRYPHDATKTDLLLSYLINKGAHCERLSSYYTSALHSAVALNAIQTVTLLLSKPSMQALINTPAVIDQPLDGPLFSNDATATPLQIAVKANNIAMVDLLIRHRANFEVTTQRGYTLLHFACMQGNFDIANYLLDAGLKPNTTNVLNSSLLFSILRQDKLNPEQRYHLIKRFLAAEVEVTTSDLSNAIEHQTDSKIFAILLEKVNRAEVSSACSLHLAVLRGRIDSVNQLISYDKGLIKSCNLLGQTPLHYAVTLKDRQIYDFLLTQGAEPNPVDYTGKTISLQALYFDTWQLYGGGLPQALDIIEFKKLRLYLCEQPEYKRLTEFQRTLALGEHSYKLIMLFGNAETALTYIARYAPAETQQALFVPLIIHNLCLFNLPQHGEWDRATWAKLALLVGPALTEYLGLAAAIEQVLGKPPLSFEMIQAAAKRVSYAHAQTNPALASICLKYKIQEVVFNRVLANYQPKKTDRLPDLYIDGEMLNEPRIYLKKLAVDDLRGFVLGALTHCCQSIGSAGEGCAMHGMQSAYGGYYAVFKKAKPKEAEKYQRLIQLARQATSCTDFINRLNTGEQRVKYQNLCEQLATELRLLSNQQVAESEILSALREHLQAAQVQASEDELIAQSWAWLSKAGNLVFDSWERLRQEDDRLCKPFLQAAARKAILQHGINKVLLGQSGQTPENLAFEAISEPEKPMDYWGYRDSLQQLLIASRESLQAESKQSSLQTTGFFGNTTPPQRQSYAQEEFKQLLSYYCKQAYCTVLTPTKAELLEQMLAHYKASTVFPHIVIVPIQKPNLAWVSWVIVQETKQQIAAYYLDAQVDPPSEPQLMHRLFAWPDRQNLIKNQVVFETDPLKSSAWLMATLATIGQEGGIAIKAWEIDKLLIEQQAVLEQPQVSTSLSFVC